MSGQIEQQAVTTSEIARAASTAAGSASSASAGVTDVALEVRQTQATAGDVLAAAQELSTQSQDLAEVVSTFLCDLEAA